MLRPWPTSTNAAHEANWRYSVGAASSLADAAMIARRVRRHRPQSPPAPHAAATSLDVAAPCATASDTVWLVAPTHRHTYISAPPARGQPFRRELGSAIRNPPSSGASRLAGCGSDDAESPCRTLAE